MHINRLLTITGAMFVGAIVLTACGDDAPAALSKSEFIEQADAMCQSADEQIEPIFDAVYDGFEDLDMDDPTQQDLMFARFEDAINEVAPIWRDTTSDIGALGRPDGDEQLIETLLDDFDSALDEMQAVLATAAAGDEEAREQLDDSDDPMTDVNRRAREYGLTVCGDDS